MMNEDVPPPPPVDVCSKMFSICTFTVLVTASAQVSVNARSTYCADALTMAVPEVVKPLMPVKATLSAAVPMLKIDNETPAAS
jgi:hypothetical protein